MAKQKNIDRADPEASRAGVEAWAKGRRAKFREERGSYFIDLGKTEGVEVVPADGWAQVHGFGTLEGLSTNIASADDLDAVVDALRAEREFRDTPRVV